MRYFSKLRFAVIASTLGAFHHGYHSGVINIPAPVFVEWITEIQRKRKNGDEPSSEEVELLWSASIAMFPVGGIFGGLLSGYVADKFGRKRCILWNNISSVWAFMILGLSKTINFYEIFMLGRLVAGFGAGINLGVCQMYLVEIAPDKLRGGVCGFYHVVALSSVLISNIVGIGLGTKEYWHIMFYLAAIPCVVQLLSFPFCPESPKYLLLTRDREFDAEIALAWLRETPHVQKEMEALKEEDNLVKEMLYMTLKRLGKDPIFRTPLVVCLLLNCAQEFCGINALIYFSFQIFEDVNITNMAAKIFTVVLVLVGVVAALFFVRFVDRGGRRIFLLVGFVGLALITFGLCLSLILSKYASRHSYINCLSLGFIFVFMVFFSSTLGPIAWFITAEIFSHSARGLAVSLAVSINALANFTVSQTFLVLKDTIGYYIFLLFVFMDVFFYFFTLLYLPETGNLSAKQIMQMYK